ncbi:MULTISPECIES: hypothetical protein [Bacillus]|uniref:Uncharacterized protein n=2 Tax=Bacillus thuringiensis TaxID=1428 RepID=A0AAP4Q7B2_BACTU|nr:MULTISPECIES: hypothetical protein [Bacillus]MEC0046306.1 hypothetical protein [Bacillus cereus]AFV21670.1 hypothetical protein BTB_502p03650 [Bacillus thuringiensis Bt407]ERI01154.1 hypothetical protein BTCBT_002709 [Bacillus thuringiensis T01-328]MBN6707908.1 hypothetical protein [Bacillus thuringiensis]MDN7078937.1 hypothetical protein [Bacillus thuringiensis]
MSIFYHISMDLQHSGEFVPRIPSCRHQDKEDDVTNRICVSRTIDDCLSAIPSGGAHLEELNIEQRGYYKVFKIDTEKLGIEDSDIVSSDVLYQEDLVRDAEVTNEHWILKGFQVAKEDSYIIKLIAWEESSKDIVPEFIYRMAEEQYGGDYVKAYTDHFNGYMPCSTFIVDAGYVKEFVNAGMTLSFYFDTEEEKEYLLSKFQLDKRIHISYQDMDTISICIKEDMSCEELFTQHLQFLKNNLL